MAEVGNEWKRGKYSISTERSRLDPGLIHDFLKTSYWAKGVSEENVRRRIENSLVLGLYDGEKQAGFARVVTDYAAFTYLADVFVLESYRNRRLGGWLVEVSLSYPGLEDLKWTLATKDAHEFYRGHGFTELKHPEDHMEKPARKGQNV